MSNSDLRQKLLPLISLKIKGKRKGEELQLVKQCSKKKTRFLQSYCFYIAGTKYQVTGSPQVMSICLAAILSHDGAEKSDL